MSKHIYIYIYIYMLRLGRHLVEAGRSAQRARGASGVHKGGFSKGVFSNLCVIIMPLLLNTPLLNPPL